MKPNITNTSQSLIINSYYGYSCLEKKRLDVNNEIEKKFNAQYLMNVLTGISKTLDTNILHTSQHSFVPSGTSLSSIIESNEAVFGSSGVMHLNESHISFHSYYENSIQNIVIVRLELHISSCSRKSVYLALNNLSDNHLFNGYDAITLDFFHRGINLMDSHDNYEIINSFIEEKSKDYNIEINDVSKKFSHYKILRKKDKIKLKELSEYIYKHLI
tara:strand:- start:3036 stop:3683 length:648 start_codon:yes stop_codon:yes gene_type:complete